VNRIGVPPYRPRQVQFVRLATSVYGTLKVYTISVDATHPDPDTIDAALNKVYTYLRQSPREVRVAGIEWDRVSANGAGSLIVHRGTDATFAVLDWWVGINMLRHHVWAAPRATPTAMQSLADTDIAMCVWELAVIQHERAAWLRHVLTPDATGDVDAYLADTISGFF
jgi:hypothetical protein